LQAYAEGFEILKAFTAVPAPRHAPDRGGVASRFGRSFVDCSIWPSAALRSWIRLLEHIKATSRIRGEGRWTVLEAIEENVAAPVTALSLFARFTSRQDDPSDKMIAALR